MYGLDPKCPSFCLCTVSYEYDPSVSLVVILYGFDTVKLAVLHLICEQTGYNPLCLLGGLLDLVCLPFILALIYIYI